MGERLVHILEMTAMLAAANPRTGVECSDIEDGLRQSIDGLGRLALALVLLACACLAIETATNPTMLGAAEPAAAMSRPN